MQSGLIKSLVTIAAYLLAQGKTGAVPSPPSASYGQAGSRAVVGYYSEYYQGDKRPYNALSARSGNLTAIASFNYYLDGDGNLSGVHPVTANALAKSRGLKVLALIHNHTRAGGFDGGTAHKLLTNPTARGRAVAAILNLVRTQGYHGINLDLENVPARDRAYYTAFVRELAQALRPQGYLVTASIPAKTRDERNNNWSGAFDYAALSPWLDQVMLMTYDEYSASGQAGPVASLPWVEKVVGYARSVIPSRKILIGLAGYGYDWAVGKSGAKAREFPEIQSLADRLGLAPRWDERNKVPYIRYYSGGRQRVIWYENNWSVAHKLELVNRYNLGGVALWRLGGEDPGIWPLIQERLRPGWS